MSSSAVLSVPALGITIAHHFGSGTLASFEKLTASRRRGVLPDAEAWAAGTFGWLVMIGASIVTNLVLLVLEPPKLEPEAFGVESLVSGLAFDAVSIRSAIWVTTAAILYELQRRGRRHR